MSSRVVLHPGSGTLRPAPRVEFAFAPGQQASILPFPVAQTAEGELLSPVPSGAGCIRAVRAALVIETFAALAVYALWRLVHLLH